MTQRHNNRAGQRCNINHFRRFKALYIGQRIAQYQSSLCICVQYFNCFTRHGGHNIAWLRGTAARHILSSSDDANDVYLQIQFGDSLHYPKYRTRSAHIEFHRLHAFRGLKRDTAGIKSDAFSNQAIRRVFGVASLVLNDD